MRTMVVKSNYLRTLAAALIAALAAGMLVAGVKPAQAAFPGKNGAIAFESPSNFGGRDIWVQSPYGNQQAVDLTNDGASDNGHPTFSPDRKKILFRKDLDPFGPGNYEVFVMNADGSNQTRLTNYSRDDDDPSWSPDGKQIVFSRNVLDNGGQHPEIYVMNADGSGQTPLTTNSGGRGPQFSPDGTRIAFWSGGGEQSEEIYTMNADGSNPRQLTNNSWADFAPNWSPDGKHIAFSSNQVGNYDIWVMHPDGSNKQNLTSNSPANDFEPAWSPDGAKIAFVSTADIYTMNADGTGQAPLTASGTGFHFSPNWGNDSTPPTVTLNTPADGATYKAKRTVDADYTCADDTGGSGLKSCNGNVPTGSPIDTSTVGTRAFTVTAEDYAGNKSTVTHTYDVTHSGKPPKK